MAATEIIENRNSMFFTLGWKQRKAIRSVLRNGTFLRVKETKGILSSRFYVQARTKDQMEELAWVAVMVKSL